MAAITPNSNFIDQAGNHLANERTFLAWVRTSISVIVFGFVVAKFGITLREFLQLQHQQQKESQLSLGIGVAFMAMGVFMALAALLRYQVTMRALESGNFKPARTVIIVAGAITALFGILLAAYLIVTTERF